MEEEEELGTIAQTPMQPLAAVASASFSTASSSSSTESFPLSLFPSSSSFSLRP